MQIPYCDHRNFDNVNQLSTFPKLTIEHLLPAAQYIAEPATNTSIYIPLNTLRTGSTFSSFDFKFECRFWRAFRRAFLRVCFAFSE